MTLTQEDMFERNLALARTRLLQMIENPGAMDFIPTGAYVINLPRNDAELLEANLQLALELARNGDERPIVLIPESSKSVTQQAGNLAS